MAFRKPIRTGLSAAAGGVFALGMSIPAPTIDILFKTGPTFHVLVTDSLLQTDADPKSKIKGTLKQGSCVQWIEKAGKSARVLLQTSTELKRGWIQSSLLDPAPPERNRDSCKARFIPGADQLDNHAR